MTKPIQLIAVPLANQSSEAQFETPPIPSAQSFRPSRLPNRKGEKLLGGSRGYWLQHGKAGNITLYKIPSHPGAKRMVTLVNLTEIEGFIKKHAVVNSKNSYEA